MSGRSGLFKLGECGDDGVRGFRCRTASIKRRRLRHATEGYGMKYLAIIVGILVVLCVPAFASNEVLVSSTEMPLIFNLVSSTDHVTPLTGATATVVISKNGASFGSPSGSVSEIGDGWYEVAANATDTGTKGVLIVHATATGADASDTRYLVVAYDPLTTGAGGVVTVGTGTGQLNPSSGTLTGVGLAATQTGVTIPTVTTVTNQLSAATVATATAADILVSPARANRHQWRPTKLCQARSRVM